MKKLLSLLTLLIVTMGASAQDWNVAYHEGYPQAYTNIMAELVVNNGPAVYAGNYTIGVYVDGECRDIARDNDIVQEVQGKKFLLFQVPGNYGNEDPEDGASISFVLRDNNNNFYSVKCSQEITFCSDCDTYGYPPSSNLIQLTVTLPSSITFNPFVVEKGQEIDLMDQLVLTPADAQLPQDYYWDLGNSEIFAEIHGDMLKGTQVTTNAPISLWAGGEELASTTFSVIQHATAINIVTDEFQVEKGSTMGLTMFMRNVHNFKAYSLDPEDATDEVLWEIKDDSFIEVGMDEEGLTTWTPIKGGTTRIRPYIMQGNDKLTPANDQWITINIHVSATNLTTDWPQDPETGDYVSLKANVGDDISDIYNAIGGENGLFKVYPGDATNKVVGIKFANQADFESGILEWDDYGHGIAKKEGVVTLRFYAIENDAIFKDISVEVFNPAKTIDAKEGKSQGSPLMIDKDTPIDEAAAEIELNLTWGPEGSIPNGYITSTGAITGEGGISANGAFFDITAPEELERGDATVTATVYWNDYSNYKGTNATIVQQSASVTFYVKIIEGLDHFEITIVPNTADPTTGTITLTPVPEQATFNWEDYSLTASNNMYGNWDVLTVTDTGNGTYTYSASLPGEWSVMVDGTSQDEPEWLTIPAKVSLASGWQWKSNNCGSLMGVEALSNFFGDNLVEARTYNDLLYNDPEWGYWGSMTGQAGIGQSVMYKVKMSNDKVSYLDNGDLNEEITLALVPGWNWIGSPYFYDRTIENVFGGFIDNNMEGMVIVSKANGQAEYANGTWNGNLKMMKKGEGYYVYNPTNEPVSFYMPCEIFGNMDQGDETPAGARSMRQSVWSYDHTQFASNMSMVAEMPELENAENYTIGAFVDGECRGEGSFENGLAFITVHTNGGEQVNFVLHNELTDEYADIDETVVSRTRIGSVKAPVMLTSNTVVTGINDVQHSAFNVQRSTFNVDGRAIGGSTKGVSIRKMSDGTVRKVVIK
ncbi:MAG: hypothetical protein J5552_07755 [Prevotella sp.]|nr:hypothetical protein [Prevotella sp.]